MEEIRFEHRFAKLGFKGSDIAHTKFSGDSRPVLLWFMASGPDKARLVSVGFPLSPGEAPLSLLLYESKYYKHTTAKVFRLPRFIPVIVKHDSQSDYASKIGKEFKFIVEGT